jgi:hypothetical protein
MVAITRGLMILKEVGDGTAGNGVSAKKGVTHILGGGLATSVGSDGQGARFHFSV